MLKTALRQVLEKDYYHSELVTNVLVRQLNFKKPIVGEVVFQAREKEFLELACSELTYKEIADVMCLSPRTIDSYRENLFIKFEVKSRVGVLCTLKWFGEYLRF